MGFGSRLPTSNDPPRSKPAGQSKYLEPDDIDDEISLLLSGRAKRCGTCRKAVRTKYLNVNGVCPDCR